ncbi:cytochrome P450 [Amycolatopsis sp. NPDC004079]|uniref:cytochrome P450 n=1 Tax=Amycolatopsis sp. NPDC004079 TaxID=3154549 RepID=UPI0033B0C57D
MTEAAETAIPAFPMPRGCPFAPPAGYHELRAERPVSRVVLPTGRTCWLVTSYEHARPLLADPRVSSRRADPGYPALAPGAAALSEHTKGWLTWMDPPEHTAHRRMVLREFTVRRVQAMRPRIQRIVDERLDAMLAAGGPADLVAELSLPVPSLVICELLGVPYADWNTFQRNTAVAARFDSTMEERIAALGEVRAYLDRLVADKETDPAEDLLSRLIVGYQEAGDYDHDHLTSLATQLLIGGHETTANMISLGVLALLEHPEQLAALTADAGLMPAAVEELLRYFSIADVVTGRVALADIEIGDVVIGAGDGLYLPLAAANHDGAAYRNPHELDIHRDSRGHLAFGHGIHQCVGQQLARLELAVTYRSLFERIPGLRTTVPATELRYRDNATIFGVAEVPVTW